MLSVSDITRPRAAARRRWTCSSARSPTRTARSAVVRRAVGHRAQRVGRAEAHQGIRRPGHRPGSGRGRVQRHAAQRDRHRARRFRAAGRRDAGDASARTTSGHASATRMSSRGRRWRRIATALREVLTLLRVRTGHDFSNYKPATVLRRIERRMTVRELPTIAELRAVHPRRPAGGGGADEGAADQRHEFLPRPGGLRGA